MAIKHGSGIILRKSIFFKKNQVAQWQTSFQTSHEAQSWNNFVVQWRGIEIAQPYFKIEIIEPYIPSSFNSSSVDEFILVIQTSPQNSVVCRNLMKWNWLRSVSNLQLSTAVFGIVITSNLRRLAPLPLLPTFLLTHVNNFSYYTTYASEKLLRKYFTETSTP